MLGLDYSSGRPRGSEVKRLGYDFVIRYCGQPGNRKNATKSEVDDMLANGVAVALVFESTAARAAQGFDAGVADAKAATAHQAALGIPASRPIYYAVDFDADPAAVEDYFRGVNSVPGPDSAYGGFRVVQRLKNDGLVVDIWQTVAWSKGQRDPRNDLFQRLGYAVVDGVQCDVNEAFTADFGQHPLKEDEMSAYETNVLERISNRLGALLQLEKHVTAELTKTTTGGIDDQLDEDLPFVARFLQLEQDVAELKARPVGDIDEAVLAAELHARGWDPASAAEVKEIVRSAFARAGQPEGGTES